MKKLDASGLKKELWDTLLKLKNKKISPIVANSVATQSREILRIAKLELDIAKAHNEKPSKTILKDED